MNNEPSFRQQIDMLLTAGVVPVIESCESCHRVRFDGAWSTELTRVAPESVRSEPLVMRQTVCRDCLTVDFPEYFAA